MHQLGVNWAQDNGEHEFGELVEDRGERDVEEESICKLVIRVSEGLERVKHSELFGLLR